MIKTRNRAIPECEQGVILVKFKDAKADEEILSRYSKGHHFVETHAMKHFGDHGHYKVKVDDIDAAIADLSKNPKIKWATKNFSRSTQLTIDDPYWKDGSLWGLKKIGADIAWAAGNIGDQKIFIGVIDEGIQFFHDDLCGQLWTNPDEIDGNGLDDDNSGYADDIHGWDFRNKDGGIYDGPGDSHGTHVSGTIGAKANNSLGVIGVCPNVTIVSGKFLEDYGYDDDAVLALDYMIWLKVNKGLNIVAINNSWGGTGYDPLLHEAIDRARQANILFVCAAGNSAQDSDIIPMYPAAYDNDNIISVAAIQEDDALAYFSNWGAKSVDLGAPGVRVWSTIPGSANESSYAAWGGTSMATPHVTGACALYAATQPAGIPYQQIKNAILSTVTPNPNLAGKCTTGGTLNVRSFTNYVTPSQQSRGCVAPPMDTIPPSPPQNLRVTDVGANIVSLAWDAATDEGSGIKDYWIFINDENWAWQLIGDTWRSIAIGGLAAVDENGNPITYKFFMKATDKWNNWSGISNEVFATPKQDSQPPTTPTNVNARGVDQDTILVTWSPSTDDAGIYRYNIYHRKLGDNVYQKSQQGYYSYFYEIDGLLPGTDYEIYMTALDISGNESAPSDVVIGRTTGEGNPDIMPPSIPQGIAAKDITEHSITLLWSPSTDNVGVKGYNVFWKTHSAAIYQLVSSTGAQVVFSDLADSTLFDFYVTAFDEAGNESDPSEVFSAATLVPVIPPEPPGDITIVLSGENKRLSWVITEAVNPLVELRRKVKSHSGYSTVMSGGIGFISYSIPPKPVKTYWWQVRVTEGGKVFYSNEIQQ